MTKLKRACRAQSTLVIAGFVALACCAAGAFVDSTAFFAAWLVAWWTCAGMILGAQANLWLHALTGGSWMLPLRRPFQQAASTMPALSMLMLPLFFMVCLMYPWADHEWAAGLTRPAFKTLWLEPPFVVLRLFIYIAIWNVLIRLSRGGARHGDGAHHNPRKGFSAFGMLAFGYTVSLAAVDLIMALMPDWYSSGFGLAAITMQMKASFALAVYRGARQASPMQRRDLGNLLLMYVLMWAYLAFVQFQIIWAENLPHEIAWYLPRVSSSWQWLGIVLIVGGFFLPLLLLLSRSFKENARCLQALAGLLCAMSVLESVWLILPSIQPLNINIIWMCPLALAGMAALLRACAADRAQRHALWCPPAIGKQGANHA